MLYIELYMSEANLTCLLTYLPIRLYAYSYSLINYSPFFFMSEANLTCLLTYLPIRLFAYSYSLSIYSSRFASLFLRSLQLLRWLHKRVMPQSYQPFLPRHLHSGGQHSLLHPHQDAMGHRLF